MSGDFKDIAVVLNGDDSPADRVGAGIALRLAYHHGAMLTVFENADGDIDSPPWSDDDNDGPYAAIDFCGLSKPQDSAGYLHPSAMAELRREAHHGGGWHRGAQLDDFLPRIRCVDLVVVGSPLSERRWSTPDAANIVLTAGRPVLLVPRKFAQRPPSQRKIGHRVLVAWNASAPSTRAVHDALPFLRQAEEVLLLFVNQQTDSQTGQHLLGMMAAHLGRHGVRVRPEVVSHDEATPTRVILDRLSELDVDLLVMGAFSRPRLSEAWFGGASEDLLRQVAIPILAAH